MRVRKEKPSPNDLILTKREDVELVGHNLTKSASCETGPIRLI